MSAVVLMVAVHGPLLVWVLAANGMSIILCGNPRVLPASMFAMTVLINGCFLMGLVFTSKPEWLALLVDLLPLLVGLVLVLALVGLSLGLVRSRRLGLARPKLWGKVALAIALLGGPGLAFRQALDLDGRATAILVVAEAAVMLLALLPFVTAPLSIHHNRHR